MSEPSAMTPADGSALDVQVSRPVLLRQAREAAGLHIAALAAALKVPVKKLEALEAGRYAELPDMTFARALASSACRQLKIDPAPVLGQIPLGHLPQLGDAAQGINTPFKHAQDPAPHNPMGWLSRPAVLGAIALLLAALVLVYMPQIESARMVDAVTPSGSSAAVAAPVSETPPSPGSAAVLSQATAPAPAATNAAASDVPMNPSAPVVVAGQVSASSTAVASASAVTGAATPAPTPGALLSIAATGESWVEVVNGSGRLVMQRMLKSGDLIEFSTAPPYSVVLGRADAAQVTVRGQPFDVAPFARNSVARFEVK